MEGEAILDLHYFTWRRCILLTDTTLEYLQTGKLLLVLVFVLLLVLFLLLGSSSSSFSSSLPFPSLLLLLLLPFPSLPFPSLSFFCVFIMTLTLATGCFFLQSVKIFGCDKITSDAVWAMQQKLPDVVVHCVMRARDWCRWETFE